MHDDYSPKVIAHFWLNLEPPRYTHYGEIYKQVDMRAEVGRMTRNIHITSKVAEGQTNGGHVKVSSNFNVLYVKEEFFLLSFAYILLFRGFKISGFFHPCISFDETLKLIVSFKFLVVSINSFSTGSRVFRWKTWNLQT